MKRPIEIADRTFEIESDDDYLANMPHRFEPAMTELFRTLIQPQDVVADIGGNIGMTALLFGQLAAKVHAFEPSPSTYAFLSRNVEASGLKTIMTHNIGFGDDQAEHSITFAASNRSGGFVSDAFGPLRGHVTEKIRIDTVDAFFAARTAPNFIKIDVEGFEPAVLRGAQTTLERARPTVVLELNHFCLNVMHRVTLPDFFDQLRALFPLVLAVENRDTANVRLANLHDPDASYGVMHSHVTTFAFPNIVVGFDPAIGARLNEMADNMRHAPQR